jgi:GDPmannose 4,6-dehydratase
MLTALITGISGQDGSLLAEFLIGKGYRVVGTTRCITREISNQFGSFGSRITLVQDDLQSQSHLTTLLSEHRPEEIYNLAAQSSLVDSMKDPVLTGEINALGVTRLLEAIRLNCPQARFFQASSSEIFGNPQESPQTELTLIAPRNPYGAAKAYSHWMTLDYRRRYGLFACSGILFNHESPRRRSSFVTRKVSQGVAMIKQGLSSTLRLGNLDARRDWGYAGDYVRCMWLMLQAEKPEDYVVATGKSHTVRDLCVEAFQSVGLNYANYVTTEELEFRPSERVDLVGKPTKAEDILGWTRSVSFGELIRTMVAADIERVRETIPS